MGELDTAVNTLHADCVLVVFVELAEDVKQFCLRNLGYQLDHLIQNNGGLLADLRCIIFSNLSVHRHNLLAILGAKERVHAWEQVDSSALRCVELASHQSLKHRHDCGLKVFDPYHCKYLFDTFSSLQSNSVSLLQVSTTYLFSYNCFFNRAQTLEWTQNVFCVLWTSSKVNHGRQCFSEDHKHIIIVIHQLKDIWK